MHCNINDHCFDLCCSSLTSSSSEVSALSSEPAAAAATTFCEMGDVQWMWLIIIAVKSPFFGRNNLWNRPLVFFHCFYKICTLSWTQLEEIILHLYFAAKIRMRYWTTSLKILVLLLFSALYNKDFTRSLTKLQLPVAHSHRWSASKNMMLCLMLTYWCVQDIVPSLL